jgi:putative long chain acyl-CoA synthase
MGAQNALEVLRLGRLTQHQGTDYEVVHQEAMFKLRRYHALPRREDLGKCPPVLLIPPLMLTAEIYDVAPELSAVNLLSQAGVDAWVIDFGSPEKEEGGMERTLDDHVRAVSSAIRIASQLLERPIHVAGYSQGGMFAYQVAAYRKSAGFASIITFGSPVDLHSNLPSISPDVTERIIEAIRPLADFALEQVEGIPGIITSTGFKLLTPVKEAQQLVDFVRKLHDRKALEKRESRRRFLGGDGFVAWPGPALRKFIDDFIVHNRMASGGFVIDGRTVTLSDIQCPILSFIGLRDEIARPKAVRAIRKAAPQSEYHEAFIKAGHFGLVVGSQSLSVTWPTVVEWLRWRDGLGPKPGALMIPEPVAADVEVEEADFDVDLDMDFDLFVDTASRAAKNVWNRLGNNIRDAGETFDNLRWQLPRLSRLQRLEPDSEISPGQVLAEQAEEIPDNTFFLWKSRAFSYRDADTRVNHVVRGLIECGIRPGDRIGVIMIARPSYLSLVTAINRIGAVSVLISPALSNDQLESALLQSSTKYLITDPQNIDRGKSTFQGNVLVLGGGGKLRSLGENVVDMEAIDPAKVELPGWYKPNPGRAKDLAIIMFSIGKVGQLRSVRITNRRWAFSAYGAAAACTLSSKDTVYCCLPLHHPAGILVSAGGALVGGSRIALASRFAPDLFWKEVRRYGATIVFYAGEMCRELVNAPTEPFEHNHPLRLFAGSGMRKDVWRRLTDRFRVGVLEFYASTEGNSILANASGEKIGALGRPLPGATHMAVAKYDFDSGQFFKDAAGFYVRCDVNEPGIMIAHVDPVHPWSQDPDRDSYHSIHENVFKHGDKWFVSQDVVRMDEDGDYWFVDRISNMMKTTRGAVASRQVEDALYQIPSVQLAVVIGIPIPGTNRSMPVASIKLQGSLTLDPEELLTTVTTNLRFEERPKFVRIVKDLSMTDGFRPIKAYLRKAGVDPNDSEVPTYWYNSEQESYLPLDVSGYRQAIFQLGGNLPKEPPPAQNTTS